jgi:hypothetical protein
MMGIELCSLGVNPRKDKALKLAGSHVISENRSEPKGRAKKKDTPRQNQL